MQDLTLRSACTIVLLASLFACGSTNGETRERIENSATQEIEQGLSAELVKVSYTAEGVEGTEGAKCDYARSWLQVTNLTDSLRDSINAALDHDPRHTVKACKNFARFEGGVATIEANTRGVLSVVYRFDTIQYGDTYSELALANLDLKSGNSIPLSDVVDPSGVELLIARCDEQWAERAREQGDPEARKDFHCRKALTGQSGQANEQFSLSPAGVVVRIDREVPRGARRLLPQGGFVIPWADLKASRTGAAAWRLAPDGT